ncbi:putative GPI-anchored protein pfl2 [Hyalella azteca]|uniref:GPI-anchored protein pfl2 n=1 Tax=Hyalella azteca TaxID=294128 RepID=A0A8B7NWS7_HYAAZ|nr:putative GPI-anchored protein pfl2 [Hyalella azteca]
MDITTATWSASRFYSIRKWKTTSLGHQLPLSLLLLVALGSFVHAVSGSSVISPKIEISEHLGSPVNFVVDLERASEGDRHNLNGRWEESHTIPRKRSITLNHLNKNHPLLANAFHKDSFGRKVKLIESRTPEEVKILSFRSQARSSQDDRSWRSADRNIPKSQIPEKNLAFIKESKSYTKFSFENFLRTTPITTTTVGTTSNSITPVDRLGIYHNSGQIEGNKNISGNSEDSNGVLDTIRRYKEYTFSPDPAHLSSNLLRNVLPNQRKLVTPAGVQLPTPVPFVNVRVASLPNNTFSVPPVAGFTFRPSDARPGSSLTDDSEASLSPGETFLNTESPALRINKSDVERAGSAQITTNKPSANSTTPTTPATFPTTHSTTPTTTTTHSTTPTTTTTHSTTPTTTTTHSTTPTTPTTHSTTPTTPTTGTHSTTPTTPTTHSTTPTTPTTHSTTATSNSTTPVTSIVKSTEAVTGLPSSVVTTQQFLTRTSQAVVSSEPSTGGPSVTEQIKVEPIVTAGAGDPTAAFVFLSLGLVTILIGIFFIFKICKERVQNENVRPYLSRSVSDA